MQHPDIGKHGVQFATQLGSVWGTPLVNTNTKLWKITMFNNLMGKSTISMAIFNSYVSLPEGKWMNVKSQSPFASIKSFRCACRIRCESLQASKYKKHRKYLYGTMDRTDRTCFQLRKNQTYYIYIYCHHLWERKMKPDIVQPSQYATPAIWSPFLYCLSGVPFVLASSGLFARNQLAHTWQPLVMLVLH